MDLHDSFPALGAKLQSLSDECGLRALKPVTFPNLNISLCGSYVNSSFIEAVESAQENIPRHRSTAHIVNTLRLHRPVHHSKESAARHVTSPLSASLKSTTRRVRHQTPPPPPVKPVKPMQCPPHRCVKDPVDAPIDTTGENPSPESASVPSVEGAVSPDSLLLPVTSHLLSSEEFARQAVAFAEDCAYSALCMSERAVFCHLPKTSLSALHSLGSPEASSPPDGEPTDSTAAALDSHVTTITSSAADATALLVAALQQRRPPAADGVTGSSDVAALLKGWLANSLLWNTPDDGAEAVCATNEDVVSTKGTGASALTHVPSVNSVPMHPTAMVGVAGATTLVTVAGGHGTDSLSSLAPSPVGSLATPAVHVVASQPSATPVFAGAASAAVAARVQAALRPSGVFDAPTDPVLAALQSSSMSRVADILEGTRQAKDLHGFRPRSDARDGRYLRLRAAIARHTSSESTTAPLDRSATTRQAPDTLETRPPMQAIIVGEEYTPLCAAAVVTEGLLLEQRVPPLSQPTSRLPASELPPFAFSVDGGRWRPPSVSAVDGEGGLSHGAPVPSFVDDDGGISALMQPIGHLSTTITEVPPNASVLHSVISSATFKPLAARNAGQPPCADDSMQPTHTDVGSREEAPSLPSDKPPSSTVVSAPAPVTNIATAPSGVSEGVPLHVALNLVNVLLSAVAGNSTAIAGDSVNRDALQQLLSGDVYRGAGTGVLQPPVLRQSTGGSSRSSPSLETGSSGPSQKSSGPFCRSCGRDAPFDIGIHTRCTACRALEQAMGSAAVVTPRTAGALVISVDASIQVGDTFSSWSSPDASMRSSGLVPAPGISSPPRVPGTQVVTLGSAACATEATHSTVQSPMVHSDTIAVAAPYLPTAAAVAAPDPALYVNLGEYRRVPTAAPPSAPQSPPRSLIHARDPLGHTDDPTLQLAQEALFRADAALNYSPTPTPLKGPPLSVVDVSTGANNNNAAGGVSVLLEDDGGDASAVPTTSNLAMLPLESSIAQASAQKNVKNNSTTTISVPQARCDHTSQTLAEIRSFINMMDCVSVGATPTLTAVREASYSCDIWLRSRGVRVASAGGAVDLHAAAPAPSEQTSYTSNENTSTSDGYSSYDGSDISSDEDGSSYDSDGTTDSATAGC